MAIKPAKLMNNLSVTGELRKLKLAEEVDRIVRLIEESAQQGEFKVHVKYESDKKADILALSRAFSANGYTAIQVGNELTVSWDGV
mgnify:CR=1 FL=1